MVLIYHTEEVEEVVNGKTVIREEQVLRAWRPEVICNLINDKVYQVETTISGVIDRVLQEKNPEHFNIEKLIALAIKHINENYVFKPDLNEIFSVEYDDAVYTFQENGFVVSINQLQTYFKAEDIIKYFNNKHVIDLAKAISECDKWMRKHPKYSSKVF